MIFISSSRRLLWLTVLTCLGLGTALFAACSAVDDPTVTPTPTRTPRPTATPTATPTPTPTPTPPWPVEVGCDDSAPRVACAYLREAVGEDQEHFAWTDDPAQAEVQLGDDKLPNARPFGTWVYALVAPFFTLEDEVVLTDLQATWVGEPTGPFAQHPLLVSADTQTALPLGEPTGSVQVVEPSRLLTEAVRLDGWAIVPFDQLEPRWKVLRVGGMSPLDKTFDPEAYPLTASAYLGAGERIDALELLPSGVTNRDPAKLSVVMMTGVTALTRGTAMRMAQEGVTYPARDIRGWLTEPDITHISNEVSFAEDCPPPSDYYTMVFCSDPSYIELLEETDIDVVELTGNHLLDWGVEAMNLSLTMYDERGLPYFGGGENVTEAWEPVTITHGIHRFAFVGCNPAGPPSVFATESQPGAAPCAYGQMRERLVPLVRQLRDQGYIPIVTLQYLEFDRYEPTPQQRADFRALVEAGAAIVSGSQAHQPQGFGFHAGGFIHYGLGNLFFDQMQRLEYRQEFLDRHVFYDGRHISTELLTAMLEDYARPRPMTPDERRQLLQTTFAVSTW